jgi:hypothetical protein
MRVANASCHANCSCGLLMGDSWAGQARPAGRGGRSTGWRTVLLFAAGFRPAGALRRSVAALSGRRGRAFRGRCGSHLRELRRQPSANLSRGVVVPPGGSPAPPGSRACEARHAGAASRSAVQTPPEAPSIERDKGIYTQDYSHVKRGGSPGPDTLLSATRRTHGCVRGRSDRSQSRRRSSPPA